MSAAGPLQHRARKRFGQNFLHDPRVIARIVDAIDPRPGQNIVEIGPGQAALTRALVATRRAMSPRSKSIATWRPGCAANSRRSN